MSDLVFIDAILRAAVDKEFIVPHFTDDAFYVLFNEEKHTYSRTYSDEEDAIIASRSLIGSYGLAKRYGKAVYISNIMLDGDTEVLTGSLLEDTVLTDMYIDWFNYRAGVHETIDVDTSMGVISKYISNARLPIPFKRITQDELSDIAILFPNYRLDEIEGAGIMVVDNKFFVTKMFGEPYYYLTELNREYHFGISYGKGNNHIFRDSITMHNFIDGNKFTSYIGITFKTPTSYTIRYYDKSYSLLTVRDINKEVLPFQFLL
jgi:hypothetical protein